MEQYLKLLMIGTILILLHPHPSHAHNGAVAIAVPVEGIVVDGDLSDWPEGMREYPIALPEYGDAPRDSLDFQGSFRIGYNEEENALYVAVEVEDESVIPKAQGKVRYNTQETCEVYVGGGHGEEDILPPLVQYHIWGDDTRGVYPPRAGRTDDFEVEVRWGERGYQHEWRIDIGKMSDGQVHLHPEMSLGFDVSIWDKDEDGSVTRMTREEGYYQFFRSELLGDVLFVERSTAPEEARLHLIESVIQHNAEGVKQDTRERTRKQTGYQMFFTAGVLTFGLLHLFLFLFYPRLRENLYAAVFMINLAAFVFLQFQPLYSPSIPWKFVDSVTYLLLLPALRFIYFLFYPRLPRRFWLFLIAVSGTIGMIWFDWFGFDAIGFNVLNGLPLVLMMEVILVFIFRRKEGTWILVIGFMVYLLLVAKILLGRLGILDSSPEFEDFFLSFWGILGIIVSMSIYLARNFAHTSKNLGTQLVQVKELSEQALQQERRIREEEVQRRLLEEELQTAHDMQMGLMPTQSPAVIGFDITGRCIPANHVGGDFFQYFGQEGKHSICLADITGHAMEAAIPAVMFDGILKTEMRNSPSLEGLFSNLNQTLSELLDSRTYVCFTMGELDPASKMFRLSNGGCPYPYHYRAVSGEITELQVDAYPLGVRIETIYPVIETQLEPGDRVIFCSDGIIEAENSERVLFGFGRTAETIQKGCSQNLTAPQLLDYLINEVKTFTGETPQGDDQTIVILGVES